MNHLKNIFIIISGLSSLIVLVRIIYGQAKAKGREEIRMTGIKHYKY